MSLMGTLRVLRWFVRDLLTPYVRLSCTIMSLHYWSSGNLAKCLLETRGSHVLGTSVPVPPPTPEARGSPSQNRPPGRDAPASGTIIPPSKCPPLTSKQSVVCCYMLV